MLWEHEEMTINWDGDEGSGLVLGKVLKKRYFTQVLKDHKELT